MKICVLVTDFEQSSNDVFKEGSHRAPQNYDQTSENKYHVVALKKTTAVKEVADLVRLKRYDVFLNLCESAWEDDTAGAEVVDTLHRLNAPYTGASPVFYNLSKQAMKMVASACNVPIPNHAFIYDDDELNAFMAPKILDIPFPLIVKHYNGHDSIGMTENCKVFDKNGLFLEASRILKDFGGVLIEEFIEGREFTVLVVANWKEPDNPTALTPIECCFPQHETFKHFDLKWKNYDDLQWKVVQDITLAEKLKKASSDIFLGSQATSYARCDFRLSETTGEIYFLEINANPSVFYESSYGSADYILSLDPMGHSGFLDAIYQNAIADQQSRKVKLRPYYSPGKGFFIRATEDIPVGDVVHIYEERPAYLVTKQHVKKAWGPLKRGWFTTYAYPFSDNVFGIWSDNNNDSLPMNHSCDPNAWLDGLNVVARRFIKKGDEVTMDYSTFITPDNESAEFRCFCKAGNCRKFIGFNDFLKPDFQNTYGGHVSDYVRMKMVDGDLHKVTNGFHENGIGNGFHS